MTRKITSVLLAIIFAVLSLGIVSAFAAEPIEVVTNEETVTFSISGSDITSAFKKALTYCQEREGASEDNLATINVPGGTYDVTESLVLSSYTNIVMQDDTVLVDKGTNIFKSPIGTTGYSGLVNITITGGTLTYPSNNTKTSCLMRLVHTDKLTIRNTAFTNNYQSHHIEFAACSNVVFDGCRFEGQTGDGKNTYYEAIQFDVLDEFNHFKDMPEYDGTMNKNITIKNCMFKDLIRGVGAHSAFEAMYQDNIKIINNTFENVSAAAIDCFNFTNATISGNVIKKCGDGIIFYMMHNDGNIDLICTEFKGSKINTNCKSSITNNKIDVISTGDTDIPSPILVVGNEVTAQKSKKVTAGNYPVGNITIDSNTITTTGYGIRVRDTINSTISNNSIKTSDTKNERQGILIANASKKNTIKGNTITNFKQGISIEESNSNEVSSNTINTPAEHGVIIKYASSNIVKGNKINSPGRSGIMSIESKKTSILSNTITSPKSHGVAICTKSTCTEITSNNISGVGSIGIYIDAASSVTDILKNTVRNSANHGIGVYGTATNINSNKLYSNSGYGVNVAASDGASAKKVTSNYYSGNKKGTCNGVSLVGWENLDSKWYYYKSGKPLKGWQKISNKWYYFNGSGVMQTGWKKLSGKWYYLNTSGVMQTGWKKLSGKWYYFNSSGVMKTGWLKLSGKWYYLDSNGVMATGSKKIGNKTYKFNSNGVCQNK